MLNAMEVVRAELGQELSIEGMNGCCGMGDMRLARGTIIIPFPAESLLAENVEPLVEDGREGK
jgi:hypothetical protein